MPGNHLAIHSPAKLQENPPDYLLVLAWNFASEIMHQHKDTKRPVANLSCQYLHPRSFRRKLP